MTGNVAGPTPTAGEENVLTEQDDYLHLANPTEKTQSSILYK